MWQLEAWLGLVITLVHRARNPCHFIRQIGGLIEVIPFQAADDFTKLVFYLSS